MPRRGRGGGQASKAEQLVNVQAMRERDEQLFAKVNLEKQFSIERLKAIGAMNFEGTANLANVEKWLSLVEKHFGVMDCP